MSNVNKDAEVFKKYLQNKKILVVDPSSSARGGIFKIFNDLGAKTSQIVLANNYVTAEEEIKTHKPDIVMAEYDLGKSCGLELLQQQRANNPDSKTCLFVLLTGNTSQSAVARSAEEDIDAYILKPFTPEVLRRTLMTTAIAKIKPSEYNIKIDAAKALLAENKLDDAEKLLNEAVPMDPKPSLALYYLGQVKFLREMMDQAEGSYKTGLSFNKIHYKCLVGLYEMLMSSKKHADAYEVVKRVCQYFPANPKRLAEVLRLAIMNQKYEDVEKYYSVFCNIDERSDILIRYVCAALVVCGKYYLQTNNRTRAFELFQKAAVTSAGRTNILKEIVQSLVDFELAKEAADFLGRFPAEAQGAAEYNLLKFQVADISGTPSTVIAMGKELIAKGFVDENLYDIMIRRARQANSPAMVENLLYEAAAKFPQSTRFKGSAAA
jgi:two-component system chemotaxis response regulator CheY